MLSFNEFVIADSDDIFYEDGSTDYSLSDVYRNYIQPHGDKIKLAAVGVLSAYALWKIYKAIKSKYFDNQSTTMQDKKLAASALMKKIDRAIDKARSSNDEEQIDKLETLKARVKNDMNRYTTSEIRYDQQAYRN